ncbi:HupE/UreJ family protein [Sinorhizobium chiapasense]|uniref:HupE/UreJ family protein n=1 Tax=Sinorhizobium chiapasense TaxID=501572 RepID=A0ABZ2BAN8_9HYPH
MSRRIILDRSSLRCWICAVVTIFALVIPAAAHEIRPAYLQIDQTGPTRYSVMWRTPLLSGTRLPVVLQFPEGVRNLMEPAERALPDSLVERRVVETTSGGLSGKRIEFTGLQATITDVLVRVHLLDGSVSTTLVRPSHPWIEIADGRGRLEVAKTFVVHGIEHILFGYDHLLFVLALILIARDWRALLLTVTAFTLAHSITLTLATLGFVDVPGPPVEATIAFSILLLACEIVRIDRGQPSLTARRPWLVAFAFGLLHGLGFAGALADLELPKGDIPLALLFFNVGVEIGQLLFIAAVIAIVAAVRRHATVNGRAAYLASTYAIGAMASFWFIERVAAF